MLCDGAMQGIEGLTGLTPRLQIERAQVTGVRSENATLVAQQCVSQLQRSKARQIWKDLMSSCDLQALSDEALDALSCLVNLQELSLSGALSLGGKGLATLKDLPHFRVNSF